MPRWTKEELDDYEKRRASKSGDGVGKPKQGKPLIEVLFPPSSATKNSKGEDDLNKTEREFFEWLKKEFEFSAYQILSQSIKLRLAKKTWYTPDFWVLVRGGWKVFEVKGFMRDDAAVKLKVAAEMYRYFQFWLVTKKKKKDGGGWDFKKITP